MINEDHISDILFTISDIFERVSEKVEQLHPGDKLTLTNLVDLFAHKYSLPKTRVYNLIKCLLDTYPGIEIRSGHNGGIIKLEDKINTNYETEEKVIEVIVPPFME